MGTRPHDGYDSHEESTTGHQHTSCAVVRGGKEQPKWKQGLLGAPGSLGTSRKTIKTGTPLSLRRHDPLPLAVLIGQHPEPLTAQNWPGWEAAGQGCDCLPSFLLMSLNLFCLFSLLFEPFSLSLLHRSAHEHSLLSPPTAVPITRLAHRLHCFVVTFLGRGICKGAGIIFSSVFPLFPFPQSPRSFRFPPSLVLTMAWSPVPRPWLAKAHG